MASLRKQVENWPGYQKNPASGQRDTSRPSEYNHKPTILCLTLSRDRTSIRKGPDVCMMMKVKMIDLLTRYHNRRIDLTPNSI